MLGQTRRLVPVLACVKTIICQTVDYQTIICQANKLSYNHLSESNLSDNCQKAICETAICQDNHLSRQSSVKTIICQTQSSVRQKVCKTPKLRIYGRWRCKQQSPSRPLALPKNRKSPARDLTPSLISIENFGRWGIFPPPPPVCLDHKKP